MYYSGLNQKYEVGMNMNRFDKLGVVDYLNEMGRPSGFNDRKRLYQSLFENIPVNYTGSAEQNTELVNALRDTYKSTGSNLGVRRPGDALAEFARKLRSRSIYEGNRPDNRRETPMSAYDDPKLVNQMVGYLFGSPHKIKNNYLANK